MHDKNKKLLDDFGLGTQMGVFLVPKNPLNSTSCGVKKIGRNHTLPFTGGAVLRKEGKVLQIG